MLSQMTIQQMKASNAQPNRFLNGFHDIQDAVMSTTSKKDISYYKRQFVSKIIPYILTSISFY